MGQAERHHVVVAGAGPAGLAAAAVLRRAGHDVLVIERDDAVGSSWRRRYAGLRLNTVRQLSGLPGTRIPRALGRYPRREDYVDYLERYAEHHRLAIRFATALERVDPAPRGEWLLRTGGGPLQARHAVVATGFDAVPCLPGWASRVGEGAGPPVVHSSEVRDPAAFAGQDVLVVGAGNTGVDLAGHLLRAGARVEVAMRTPPNVFPRDLFGLPLGPSALALDHLPARLGDSVGFVTQRVAFGDLARHGIPRAPEGFETRFRRTLTGAAVDDGFVAALKAGRTRVVANVTGVEGDELVLADGTRRRPDVVICATGYRRGLEPVVGHLGVLRPDGIPVCHGAAPEHPRAPRLYFAGFWGSNAGQLRWMPIHARRIARAVARHDRRRDRVLAGSPPRPTPPDPAGSVDPPVSDGDLHRAPG